jgi:hypothetical protein
MNFFLSASNNKTQTTMPNKAWQMLEHFPDLVLLFFCENKLGQMRFLIF